MLRFRPTNRKNRSSHSKWFICCEENTMHTILTVIKYMVVLIGILLFVGLCIGSSKVMPDYAQVYINDSSKTYLAPPCIKTTIGFRIITAGEARNFGYKPDEKCRDEGAFTQNDRSLTGIFLQTIGILKPIPARWNEDGSWNY